MYQRVTTGVAGPYPYEGTFVLPHILASVTAAALGLVSVYNGFRYRTKKGSKLFMGPKKKRLHFWIGVTYLVAWFTALVLGVRIFLLFYA